VRLRGTWRGSRSPVRTARPCVRVWGSGFGVWSLNFGMWGLALGVQGVQFLVQENCFALMRSSSEEGSYSRLANFCITQLQAERNKEEEGCTCSAGCRTLPPRPHYSPRARSRIPPPLSPRVQVSGFRVRAQGLELEVQELGVGVRGSGLGRESLGVGI
jgi:hypothetical protein